MLYLMCARCALCVCHLGPVCGNRSVGSTSLLNAAGPLHHSHMPVCLHALCEWRTDTTACWHDLDNRGMRWYNVTTATVTMQERFAASDLGNGY